MSTSRSDIIRPSVPLCPSLTRTIICNTTCTVHFCTFTIPTWLVIVSAGRKRRENCCKSFPEYFMIQYQCEVQTNNILSYSIQLPSSFFQTLITTMKRLQTKQYKVRCVYNNLYKCLTIFCFQIFNLLTITNGLKECCS